MPRRTPHKPAPLKQRKKEQESPASREEIAPTPPSKQSVQELEKASREASRNGLPAPQKQI